MKTWTGFGKLRSAVKDPPFFRCHCDAVAVRAFRETVNPSNLLRFVIFLLFINEGRRSIVEVLGSEAPAHFTEPFFGYGLLG